MTHANPDCVVEDLGITRIPEVDEYMRNLRQQRLSDLIEDRLLMLAHPPCLAVGARRLNPADLLKPKDEF
jgi:lipoate-protein ligase B